MDCWNAGAYDTFEWGSVYGTEIERNVNMNDLKLMSEIVGVSGYFVTRSLRKRLCQIWGYQECSGSFSICKVTIIQEKKIWNFFAELLFCTLVILVIWLKRLKNRNLTVRECFGKWLYATIKVWFLENRIFLDWYGEKVSLDNWGVIVLETRIYSYLKIQNEKRSM